jgi:hypothetical protein
MTTRTVEYRPARSLHPTEYEKAAKILQSVGYEPSGMIKHESINEPPVYLFFGESNKDITEEVFSIRDRMFAQIATFFTIKSSEEGNWAEGWVRYKKLECSV